MGRQCGTSFWWRQLALVAWCQVSAGTPVEAERLGGCRNPQQTDFPLLQLLSGPWCTSTAYSGDSFGYSQPRRGRCLPERPTGTSEQCAEGRATLGQSYGGQAALRCSVGCIPGRDESSMDEGAKTFCQARRATGQGDRGRLSGPGRSPGPGETGLAWGGCPNLEASCRAGCDPRLGCHGWQLDSRGELQYGWSAAASTGVCDTCATIQPTYDPTCGQANAHGSRAPYWSCTAHSWKYRATSCSRSVPDPGEPRPSCRLESSGRVWCRYTYTCPWPRSTYAEARAQDPESGHQGCNQNPGGDCPSTRPRARREAPGSTYSSDAAVPWCREAPRSGRACRPCSCDSLGGRELGGAGRSNGQPGFREVGCLAIAFGPGDCPVVSGGIEVIFAGLPPTDPSDCGYPDEPNGSILACPLRMFLRGLRPCCCTWRFSVRCRSPVGAWGARSLPDGGGVQYEICTGAVNAPRLFSSARLPLPYSPSSLFRPGPSFQVQRHSASVSLWTFYQPDAPKMRIGGSGSHAQVTLVCETSLQNPLWRSSFRAPWVLGLLSSLFWGLEGQASWVWMLLLPFVPPSSSRRLSSPCLWSGADLPVPLTAPFKVELAFLPETRSSSLWVDRTLAPKMHIGGSGMHAVYDSPSLLSCSVPMSGEPLECYTSQPCPFDLGRWADTFYMAADLVVSFVLTLRWLSLLLLLKMLIVAGLSPFSVPGRLCRAAVRHVPFQAATAFGGSWCRGPVLDWSPWVDRKGRPRPRKPYTSASSAARLPALLSGVCRFGAIVHFFLGLEFMVQPATAMIPQVPTLAEPVEMVPSIPHRYGVTSEIEKPLRPPVGSRVGISSVGFPPPGGQL